MKIIFSFLLSALLLLTFDVSAQYDPKALAILDEMSEKYQNIPAFKATFIYSLENPDQNINEDFSGEILVKGEKFRLNMGGQEIINNGATVWTYLEEANEVNVDNYDAQDGDLNPTQIFNAYKSGYKYLYLEEESNADEALEIIDLIPEDKNAQFFKVRLEINKSDKTLKSWRIFDRNGNRYLYDIDKFDPTIEASNADFEFDKNNHKGVEVVDLR